MRRRDRPPPGGRRWSHGPCGAEWSAGAWQYISDGAFRWRVPPHRRPPKTTRKGATSNHQRTVTTRTRASPTPQPSVRCRKREQRPESIPADSAHPSGRRRWRADGRQGPERPERATASSPVRSICRRAAFARSATTPSSCSRPTCCTDGCRCALRSTTGRSSVVISRPITPRICSVAGLSTALALSKNVPSFESMSSMRMPSGVA